MLDRKYVLPLKIGFSLGIFMIILELVLFYTCKNNLLCLGLLIIPTLPGLFFNLERFSLIIVSLIFWFLVGSLIGFLVYKIKNK